MAVRSRSSSISGIPRIPSTLVTPRAHPVTPEELKRINAQGKAIRDAASLVLVANEEAPDKESVFSRALRSLLSGSLSNGSGPLNLVRIATIAVISKVDSWVKETKEMEEKALARSAGGAHSGAPSGSTSNVADALRKDSAILSISGNRDFSARGATRVFFFDTPPRFAVPLALVPSGDSNVNEMVLGMLEGNFGGDKERMPESDPGLFEWKVALAALAARDPGGDNDASWPSNQDERRDELIRLMTEGRVHDSVLRAIGVEKIYPPPTSWPAYDSGSIGLGQRRWMLWSLSLMEMTGLPVEDIVRVAVKVEGKTDRYDPKVKTDNFMKEEEAFRHALLDVVGADFQKKSSTPSFAKGPRRINPGPSPDRALRNLETATSFIATIVCVRGYWGRAFWLDNPPFSLAARYGAILVTAIPILLSWKPASGSIGHAILALRCLGVDFSVGEYSSWARWYILNREIPVPRITSRDDVPSTADAEWGQWDCHCGKLMALAAIRASPGLVVKGDGDASKEASQAPPSSPMEIDSIGNEADSGDTSDRREDDDDRDDMGRQDDDKYGGEEEDEDDPDLTREGTPELEPTKIDRLEEKLHQLRRQAGEIIGQKAKRQRQSPFGPGSSTSELLLKAFELTVGDQNRRDLLDLNFCLVQLSAISAAGSMLTSPALEPLGYEDGSLPRLLGYPGLVGPERHLPTVPGVSEDVIVALALNTAQTIRKKLLEIIAREPVLGTPLVHSPRGEWLPKLREKAKELCKQLDGVYGLPGRIASVGANGVLEALRQSASFRIPLSSRGTRNWLTLWALALFEPGRPSPPSSPEPELSAGRLVDSIRSVLRGDLALADRAFECWTTIVVAAVGGANFLELGLNGPSILGDAVVQRPANSPFSPAIISALERLIGFQKETVNVIMSLDDVSFGRLFGGGEYSQHPVVVFHRAIPEANFPCQPEQR